MKKNIAIILAGGQGTRYDKESSKALVKIAGLPAIVHTVLKFEKNPLIHGIVIVVNREIFSQCEKNIQDNKLRKVIKIVEGGKTRQESSKIGLDACPEGTHKVLLHDAVRPFISQKIITEVVNSLNKYVAVDVAVGSPDTLIKVNEKNLITEIPKRAFFRRGQTPQGFIYDVICKAHLMAIKDNFTETTDDCGLVIRYNLGQVYVVEGEDENIKITYPLDIHIADKIFQISNIQLNGDEFNLQALKKKNIILFGHSSGIGAEIYKLCLECGANVQGFSRSSGVNINDFTQVKKSINGFVSKFGQIDILISSAGVLHRGNLVNMSLEAIENDIKTNYTAQAVIVHEAIPHMSKGGAIALFASSSYTRGRESYSIYSSTKAAIVNLVQALSEELADLEVNINAICPARTNTPMRRNNFGNEPIESLLDPSLVAKKTLMVCFSNMTGQVINIS